MKILEIETTTLAPFDRNDLSSIPSYLKNYFNMPEYFNREKHIKIEIVDMAPDEYIAQAEDALTKSWGNTTASRRETGMSKITSIADSMSKGDKFPLPFISYVDNLQDGLHRVEAAKELGVSKVPVIVISRFDNKR